MIWKNLTGLICRYRIKTA